MKRILAWGLILPLALACDDSSENPGGGPPRTYNYSLVDAFPNLTFSRPVDLRNAGDGTDRLFVVQQTGHIGVFANDAATATVKEFLDISSEVFYSNQSELGLLGLAFHPQYATNGTFFVYYTTGTISNIRSHLSRFQVSAGDPDAADPASEKILLDFPQPFANHKGGSMLFGGDGYLYLGLGDGGSGGDPNSNGQNLTTLLGKILRIDVDQNFGTIPYYGIPADNPFAGNSSGYREETYAFGLRNPWRISYDAATDRMWCGDVGQGAYEEIDIVANGANYGWDCREGKHAYTGPPDGPSPACASATNFVDPVFEYSHGVGESISGGYVYRGPSVTSLTGKYVYADYIEGAIWALTYGSTPSNEPLLDQSGAFFISSFGVAEDGELFVLQYFADGTASSIYRLEQKAVQP